MSATHGSRHRGRLPDSISPSRATADRSSALLRTLLVAIGACVGAWRLESRSDASAEWLRETLMRLSGRQWVWQSARAVAGNHGADAIDRLIADHLPLFAAPPNPNKDM